MLRPARDTALAFIVVVAALAPTVALDNGAQFASGARYAPTVSSRLTLYSTWLLPHGNCPRVPPRHICPQVIMPPAVNMDIKVSFEMYDMTPGPEGKRSQCTLFNALCSPK